MAEYAYHSFAGRRQQTYGGKDSVEKKEEKAGEGHENEKKIESGAREEGRTNEQLSQEQRKCSFVGV